MADLPADPDLQADYARPGFDGRLPFGRKPPLLVIDVVDAYLQPDPPLCAGVEEALASNVRLIATARGSRRAGDLRHRRLPGGRADGGPFYRKAPALKAYDRGSPLGRFPPQIAPRDDEVVSKQYGSAFFGTSLASTCARWRSTP